MSVYFDLPTDEGEVSSDLYPSVTLRGGGARIKANFGSSDFLFKAQCISRNYETCSSIPALVAQATISSEGYITATLPERKQILGGLLYPRIGSIHPELAGKFTGMILEMPDEDIFQL